MNIALWYDAILPHSLMNEMCVSGMNFNTKICGSGCLKCKKVGDTMI